MSDKLRTLPSWMAKKEVKAKEENKATLRRRKPKKPKSIFYCMNEKELVETALSLLTCATACQDGALLGDQKVEGGSAGRTRASAARGDAGMRESSEEAAYVSETDLDVSEMETLPYTTSPTRREPRGQRSDPAEGQGPRRNVGLEAGGKVENPQMPADAGGEKKEEDDAFQLVREIFFTR